MNLTTPNWLFLAQIRTAAPGNQADQNAEQDAMNLQGTAVVALALSLVLLVGWLASKLLRASERKVINSPKRLLRELLKAHQLPRAQQRLLRRMIKAYKLNPPARVLVEPEQFDTAASDPIFKSQRTRLLALKERLFGTAA